MSVLMVISKLNAPSQVFVRRHIQMLSEANILKTVAVLWPVKTDQPRAYGVPVYWLGAHGRSEHVPRNLAKKLHLPLRFPTPSDKLRKLLDTIDVDVILCEFGPTAQKLLTPDHTARYRVFIHAHGFDSYVNMTPAGYQDYLLAMTARNAKVICPGQQVFQRLLAWGIDSRALIVKPCGVEVPAQPLERVKRTENLTILHLGRLIDCKGPDKTIRAFSLACDLGFKGRLVVAGDGPYRERCAQLRLNSKWRDSIELLGAVSAEQGARLRVGADLFTLHSCVGEQTGQVESVGVAVIEAMASALPVVSCRIGGIPEAVVDGESGILVEPDDIEAQAQAFLTLARNPELRLTMGQAGWVNARDHFSYEQEKQALVQLVT
jgi:glycosyltransferase involved in cell wall biosynthesis